MPIYVVKCQICHNKDEVFRPLARIDEMPECCGETMQRQICAPMVVNDIQPYKSMMTGEMITSRSQHRTHLKDHGVVEVGNETFKPKKSWIEQKTQKESLRKEIAARFDNL